MNTTRRNVPNLAPSWSFFYCQMTSGLMKTSANVPKLTKTRNRLRSRHIPTASNGRADY
jgi:hypothetical protein